MKAIGSAIGLFHDLTARATIDTELLRKGLQDSCFDSSPLGTALERTGNVLGNQNLNERFYGFCREVDLPKQAGRFVDQISAQSTTMSQAASYFLESGANVVGHVVPQIDPLAQWAAQIAGLIF